MSILKYNYHAATWAKTSAESSRSRRIYTWEWIIIWGVSKTRFTFLHQQLRMNIFRQNQWNTITSLKTELNLLVLNYLTEVSSERY